MMKTFSLSFLATALLLTLQIANVGGENTFLSRNINPNELLQTNSPQIVLGSSYPSSDLHSQFEQWKEKFDRSYGSLHDHALRKLTFLQNHAHIEEHNSHAQSYSLGHNEFSDLTNEEFMEKMHLGEYSPGVFIPKGRSDGRLISSSRSLSVSDAEEHTEERVLEVEDDEATVANVPNSKNWVEEGAVTDVKNQWFCGACWAFSAIGAIEGARYISTGNLTDLSIQQLLDCDMTDLGCGGGLMYQAFQFDEDTVGLCDSTSYPFAYHRHWFYGCSRYMPYCTPLSDTKVKQYVNVSETEDDLRAAIATQPVSVAVNADSLSWQFYHDGILSPACEDPDSIDHGVLAVGYGQGGGSSEEEDGDYWLVKNSWGSWWGLNGYIKLGRNVGSEATGGSSCILTLASRPIMKKEG